MARSGPISRSSGEPYSPLSNVIQRATSKHQVLAEKWDELTRPPLRDWEKEERARQAKARRKRAAAFDHHRANFGAVKDDIASGGAFGPLHSLAMGYLSRYSDLDQDVAPIERLKLWVGDDIAQAATKGFVASLGRNDLPTVAKILEARVDGQQWNIEPVMLCGVAEMVRSGQPLTQLPEGVTAAVLAVWWDMPEFNSSKFGEDIQGQLEDCVFKSDELTETFLLAMIEPQIKAGKQHVSGLYRLARDARFRRVAPGLALRWLKAYPEADQSVQRELLQIALHEGAPTQLESMVGERLQALATIDPVAQRMWIAAAFLLDLPGASQQVADSAKVDKSLMWSIRDLARPDDSEPRRLPLTVTQLERMVEIFAPLWPVTGHPESGWWGDENPWDATNYIGSLINSIGTVATSDASDALDRLLVTLTAGPYFERIKHVRAQQRRLRLDNEYVPPTFEQIKHTLADSAPGTIDDLKALIVDHLVLTQEYLRNADTDGWEAFWESTGPKVENTCRDQLLDVLRPRVPQVELIPERLMPEKNRCDVALHDGKGLPIEVKGQWHSEVWNASQTQLYEKYGRDWRADDRGVYLVLWFGHVGKKNLTANPDGLPAPTTPGELKAMLEARLSELERARIEVVVLDVSKPASSN